MNKILVTGGAGFIGSHLADALVAEGHRVTVADNLRTGLSENLRPDRQFVHLDICSPEAGQWVAEQRFDAIFHLAAQVNVRFSTDDPAEDARLNILGSLNLLEAARKAGTRQFIFASSGGTVYGVQAREKAQEDDPLAPLSPYGSSKAAIELYLGYYREQHGLKTVALRYSNVYGPRQNPHGEAGVVAIFCEKMNAGQAPTIFGDGKQTRDYVHVADVVRANLAALRYPQSGTFNVGTGQETDVLTIFSALNAAYGNRFVAQHAPARVGELPRNVLSIERAGAVLQWRPERTLNEGLAETVAWYQDRIPSQA